MATDASEKKAAPPAQEAEQLPCPRCDSTNTKFCYYNNYNLSQPRHFCKSCRRYWTHGGALRDIPVGGATRKNAKRPRNIPAAAGHGSGGFTTLFNSSPATGLLALGGPPWPFAAHTWQPESGESGFLGGGGFFEIN